MKNFYNYYCGKISNLLNEIENTFVKILTESNKESYSFKNDGPGLTLNKGNIFIDEQSIKEFSVEYLISLLGILEDEING